MKVIEGGKEREKRLKDDLNLSTQLSSFEDFQNQRDKMSQTKTGNSF